MADGEILVKLDDETAQRLEALAEAAGRTVNDYVLDLIKDSLPSDDDDWSEDIAAFEEYERTGISYSVEEAMAHFDAALKTHLANRR